MREPETKQAVKKPAKGKGPSAKGKDGLTMKQRKLVKGIASGKTQKESAKLAGLNEQYASDILKKPEVKATLLELMELHGLDDASILKVHADMIKATRGDEPDWTARGKGVELAYKLKGAFIDKAEIKHSGEIIHKIERTVIRPK